ncbi:unnamed protein product [Soboliphyme baturini]|uniref:Uncharacterized protein n=1 Tax=Soboliphyme baturini TaxID=241478 RepID=A0A183IW77_9BILA|nr:unnamed protein product [Soboliphyme baturini]
MQLQQRIAREIFFKTKTRIRLKICAYTSPLLATVRDSKRHVVLPSSVRAAVRAIVSYVSNRRPRTAAASDETEVPRRLSGVQGARRVRRQQLSVRDACCEVDALLDSSRTRNWATTASKAGAELNGVELSNESSPSPSPLSFVQMTNYLAAIVDSVFGECP